MRAMLCPPHLLVFHHALADHLVHRRLDKGRRDSLGVTALQTLVVMG
jgi:hypothetical protein